MQPLPELTTPRLLLRNWRDADREPFAAMNADRAVMEFMPALLTREESDAFIERIVLHAHKHGFALWALETREASPAGPPGSFIGFAGLNETPFQAHFTPAIEIGWRLAKAAQGRGYATEAARAALDFGFRVAGLEEIVSFTTPNNLASRRVMEKLGMRRNPDEDFAHPLLASDHPLSPHVLYRLERAAWSAQDAASPPQSST